MSSKLIVKNLCFKDILKDINFELKEGTINILIGSNGSGKTILLKSLMGLVNYKGIITINGMTINKDNVDLIRKDFGIYLGLTNLENKNIFLNLNEPLKNLNYKESEAIKKIYDLSKKLGIEDLLYKEIETLSYSQKKVVSFAQSIIHEPSVILIDGLFDSLDNFYKDKIVAYLKHLRKNKKSIILFATNNEEDLSFSDSILIIKNGQISINDNFKNFTKNENVFSENDIKLPFIVDLVYKLRIYGLVDDLIYNIDEMVDKIWK